MKLKRFNWSFLTLFAAIMLLAIAGLPEGSVSEVHNADSAANFALVDPHPRHDDWPWIRGIDGRNVAFTDRIPIEWTLADGEGWQAALSGAGHSVPIVWGDHLFVATSDDAAQRVTLRSFHRETGRPLWQSVVLQGGLPKILERGTHASSTPACDGQSVFVAAAANGSLWLTSVDFNGRITWQREAGPYRAKSGYRSSPSLYKNMVIVAADQDAGGYITAFHRQTGAIVWRIRRAAGESHGSPIVATISGRPQLILGGKEFVISYDPATGDELWRCRWSANRIANMVAFDSDHVYAINKHSDGEVVCIRADGSGNVSRTHLVWRQSKVGGELPSPVLYGEHLYVLSEEGLLCCLQAATGKIKWKTRLSGVFSASPIIANDHLICCNESGVATILSTGSDWAVVNVNPLSEGIVATPIVAGNTVFVRTQTSLRCYVARDGEPVVERPEPSKRRL